MIGDKAGIATRPGLAVTWNADGFGVRSAKLEDYRSTPATGVSIPA
jgi:hypothetical protein